jgi:predicted glutamine amidotransferase
MCRLFAAAASEPVDVSFELLRSDNSILRQSEEHDSGWGSAYYSHDGVPDVRRFADAAHADESFDEVTSGRARLIMVHVRRATIGGLKLENTHPFSRGPYTYCHNGTILKASLLEPLADRLPAGDTDSERFFNMLMTGFDHDDVVGSLRRAVETVCDTCRFSALNFLFCDGRRMYAYRFGVYRLFWLPRDLDLDADTDTHHHVHLERPSGGHMVLTASEQLTEAQPWIEMEQDELLVSDPDDAEHPRVERLLGDRAGDIEFVPLDSGQLSGEARGEWAARRAATGF